MRRLLAIALACGVNSAGAQLHLPQVQLQVPQAPLQLPQAPLQLPKAPADVTSLPRGVARDIQGVLEPANLLDSRRTAVAERLRLHREVLESGPAGELIVRSEVILVAPTANTLDRARAAGFRVAVERALSPGDRFVVLRAPSGVATPDALNQLRAIDPQGQYDFNHVYVPAGATSPDPAATQPLASGPKHRLIFLMRRIGDQICTFTKECFKPLVGNIHGSKPPRGYGY